MRPLETLHNNLCFNVLDKFLNEMINDRLSPFDRSSSLRWSAKKAVVEQLKSPPAKPVDEEVDEKVKKKEI